jgi:tetratricopeptide (TPR) repeat protein
LSPSVQGHLILCAVVVIIVPLPATASTESRYLVIEGIDKLALHQYEDALKKFEAASQSDPTDAEATFYQGLALNRLGEPQEALSRLQQAQEQGATHPDIAFELGWSLLYLERWADALRELDRYELTSPGRGQTSEFRGRAYFALGDYDKAEALLQEALRRDPSLAPSVHLYLAFVARARNDIDTVSRELQAILEETPDSPLARGIRQQAADFAEAVSRASQPFRLNLSTGGGFNSNVIGLGSGILLPADISRKHAGFSNSILEGSYTRQVTQGGTLTAGYRFLANVYEGLGAFDLIDHFNYLDYRQQFRRDLSAALQVSNQFTQLGGNNFRNQYGLRPSVAWWPTNWAAVELAYSYFKGAYFFTVPSVLNPDSEAHTLGLTSFLRIPGLPLHGRVGYFHVWNDAKGNDFDFEADGVLAGVTGPVWRSLNMDAFYSRVFSHYSDLNSLSGTTGFEFRRIDATDRVTVQLSWPFFRWLLAYARYDYTRNASNVRFFDFNQQVWNMGITVVPW